MVYSPQRNLLNRFAHAIVTRRPPESGETIPITYPSRSRRRFSYCQQIILTST
jgi:hypothetical protein